MDIPAPRPAPQPAKTPPVTQPPALRARTPFDTLPAPAFWRSGVVAGGPYDLTGLYRPKFAITRSTAVATAGSCFAQHVGRALRGAGLSVLDAEPAPPGLEGASAHAHGFGLYSGRYGNIYTPRQLRQLLQDVANPHLRPNAIWRRAGRFHDALRPGTEPGGCDSADEVASLRLHHLARLGPMLAACQVFVFTLGMTEAWVDPAHGTTFPTAPGVLADPDAPVTFHNFTFAEGLADLTAAHALLRAHNPAMRLLVSVSPVPLTATATGGHILTATTASKSILRAIADEFCRGRPDVDYVPSYEIITHPAARGRFFAPNLRSVTAEGVDLVMSQFLHAHGLAAQPSGLPSGLPQSPVPTDAPATPTVNDTLICEEALSEAFHP